MRSKLLVAAGLALAAIALGLAVTNVLAHSRPIRFDPAPGAVLSTAPARVEAWFTSDIRRDSNWSFLQVTDQSGERVDTGETSLSTDRRQLSVALKSGLGPGRYLVTWRNWDDADGAIFGDCYTFFVGQAAADAAITDKARLDGGSSCQRMEFEARSGTPTAAQLQAGTGDEHAEERAGGDGLPVWALVLGVVAGVVVGGIGGRFVGSHA